MPETPKLSNTARTVLTLAEAHDHHLVRVPQLPVAAARQVIRSLLNSGLVEEIPAPVEDDAFAWRTGEDGTALMLRATPAGLAGVSESVSTAEPPSTRRDPEADEKSEGAQLNQPETSSPPAGPTATPSPTSLDDTPNVSEGERNEVASDVAILVDASIAPLVHAFVAELTKPERPPFVAAFLRRLEGGGAARRTAATGTRRAREMSLSQRRIVELCSRPEGATGKELAEGCGWPSIAARATCQKLADRFGYTLHESPRANGRGISFRLTAKPAVEA